MTPRPTGSVRRDGDRCTLTLEREFRAPIEDVWAAVTEPARLARWIGTFTGDPQSGRVVFAMTAEEGAPKEEMEIIECAPPHVLRVLAGTGEHRWLVELSLTEEGGVTTLVFVQPDVDPLAAESMGPGWEYYLDRLAAVETGQDPAVIDFDRDYYPAMLEHYRSSFD